MVMARRPRVHYPGALYHVISRGNQRQKIYRDNEDYRGFETLLGEMVKRHSLTLFAYVLMPNHFHLLLEVSRAPLSKAMQALLYRYTRRYNQRYRKSGHLFQGRYKAILCDRDSYLMELIRYLHLNPVRAGMVSDPGKYRWSSHRAYVGGKSTSGTAVEQGLELWGGSPRQAIQAYQRFMREGLETGHQERYYEVKEQRYLGEEKFVENVYRALDEGAENRPVKITMGEIMSELAAEVGLSMGVLLGKGRGREESKIRAEAAYVGREVGGISQTEAARYLGRDLSTVSLALKRVEEELAASVSRRKRMDQLCARLRQGRRIKYQINKA
jgi:REP element-mobilizing transposase RayT